MNHRLFAVILVSIAAELDRGRAAIGDQYAFERVLPEPRTCIEDGCLQGRYFNGFEGVQYEAYLGVPIARPPVGKLRFKNPVRNNPWDGDYDATWERSRCLQKNDLRPLQTVQGSEDCLYLNVYRPRNVTGPLPVIFFIHGGAFAAGSSSMGELGPERCMATRKVILVIPQYPSRFLSTEDHVSPGNYGLKDQLFALRWTQRNIAYFRGDPKLVTIVGQSARSSSVQYHMVSPQSKGLFARAVSMSESALGSRYYTVDQLALARRQAEVVGIANAASLSTEQLVGALRKVDGLELAWSIDRLKYFYVHPILQWHPTIERYVDEETFISEDPRQVWRSGRYHQVPYTTGFLPNDGAYTSVILLSNSSLLNELNENSADFIPRLVAVNHPTSVQMLKDRFFSDGTNERWLTEKNVGNLETMLSEGQITYGVILGAKQILVLNNRTTPLSVYYFNFSGPYSQSYYNSYTKGDFGISHADELLYLFRASELFPDFQVGSPSWYMAKLFVEYLVYIAYHGIGGLPCTADSCQLLEFTNSEDSRRLVKLNLIDGFDEEKFAFWTNLYAVQNAART